MLISFKKLCLRVRAELNETPDLKKITKLMQRDTAFYGEKITCTYTDDDFSLIQSMISAYTTQSIKDASEIVGNISVFGHEWKYIKAKKKVNLFETEE